MLHPVINHDVGDPVGVGARERVCAIVLVVVVVTSSTPYSIQESRFLGAPCPKLLVVLDYSVLVLRVVAVTGACSERETRSGFHVTLAALT